MNLSDIVDCNGPMIVASRKSCQMTQQSLAAAADLSVRVLRKAESGGEVRFSTLVAIANALRKHGATVQAGDLCTDPVEVVKSFLEACRIHRENAVSFIRHLLSEDLVTFVAGNTCNSPFAGEYLGPNGLTICLSRILSNSTAAGVSPYVFKYFTNGSEVVVFDTESCSKPIPIPSRLPWRILKFDVSGGIIRKAEFFLGWLTEAAGESEVRVGGYDMDYPGHLSAQEGDVIEPRV